MSVSVALRLGRVSNLPTVWSNALAGMVLASGAPDATLLLGLMLGFSASYTSGMFLNDAFDASFDQVHRPERPIPSGQISLRYGLRYWLRSPRRRFRNHRGDVVGGAGRISGRNRRRFVSLR